MSKGNGLTVLFSEEETCARVAALGRRISEDFPEENVTCIGVPLFSGSPKSRPERVTFIRRQQ